MSFGKKLRTLISAFGVGVIFCCIIVAIRDGRDFKVFALLGCALILELTYAIPGSIEWLRGKK